jgi:microcystin-dependent protein
MPFTGLNTNNDLGQNYGVINNSLRSLAKSQDGGAFNPSGVMTMYCGNTAPRGWLICDGSTVSRTQFANLFAVIGANFGTGDGSTTFNLPDMRGRVPVGQDLGSARLNSYNVLGQGAGEQYHTLTAGEIPPHQHGIRAEYGTNASLVSAPPGQYNQLTTNGAYSFRYEYTQADGGGGAGHNIMQPYQVFNYIIKV